MTLAVSPIGAETLDHPEADARLVEATLADIARVNTLLGGRGAAAFGLELVMAGLAPGSTLSLLDVGAGAGDVVRHLVRRARARSIELRPVALERHRAAARLCRESGLATLLADGGTLPVRDRSIDVALASQLLHHLSRGSATRLVTELSRVARLGVVIADLRRSPVAAAGIWVAAQVLGLHRVTRDDGVTSVRRGFTPRELGDVLRGAGVETAVHRRPGYRLVAAWRTTAGRYAHG